MCCVFNWNLTKFLGWPRTPSRPVSGSPVAIVKLNIIHSTQNTRKRQSSTPMCDVRLCVMCASAWCFPVRDVRLRVMYACVCDVHLCVMCASACDVCLCVMCACACDERLRVMCACACDVCLCWAWGFCFHMNWTIAYRFGHLFTYCLNFRTKVQHFLTLLQFPSMPVPLPHQINSFKYKIQGLELHWGGTCLACVGP